MRIGTTATARSQAHHTTALLEENEHWYERFAGGDFALARVCLLAALRDDAPQLETVLAEARSSANVEVQVEALDALARLTTTSGDLDAARSLLTQADALAVEVAHVLDPDDRLDASLVRGLLWDDPRVC